MRNPMGLELLKGGLARVLRDSGLYGLLRLLRNDDLLYPGWRWIILGIMSRAPMLPSGLLCGPLVGSL